MKSAKFLILVLVAVAAAVQLAACSGGPAVWYKEGSVDEADVVHFDVSQDRVTVHIDGKKVAIRKSEVLMAPGAYALRVVANTSFDRNPDAARYDSLIANLRARNIPYATMLEKRDAEISVTLQFAPKAGKRYKLYAEFIERPMAQREPQERIKGEFVVYIEEE